MYTYKYIQIFCPYLETEVAGSSPSTLTMSLLLLIPSFSSSNGLTTTPLTTRGVYPIGSVVWASPNSFGPNSFGLIGKGPEWWQHLLGTGATRSAKTSTAHNQRKARLACYIETQQKNSKKSNPPQRGWEPIGKSFAFPLLKRSMGLLTSHHSRSTLLFLAGILTSLQSQSSVPDPCHAAPFRLDRSENATNRLTPTLSIVKSTWRSTHDYYLYLNVLVYCSKCFNFNFRVIFTTY